MVGEWKGGEEIRKDKRKRKEREVSQRTGGKGGDRRHNSAECRLRPEVLDGQRLSQLGQDQCQLQPDRPMWRGCSLCVVS